MSSDLERFEAAEMKPRVAEVLETLETHNREEMRRVGRHLRDLWNHPDAFEAGEMVERWGGDPFLLLVELGVLFGIDYEQAYPEGRNGEWPIPIDERPDGGEGGD